MKYTSLFLLFGLIAFTSLQGSDATTSFDLPTATDNKLVTKFQSKSSIEKKLRFLSTAASNHMVNFSQAITIFSLLIDLINTETIEPELIEPLIADNIIALTDKFKDLAPLIDSMHPTIRKTLKDLADSCTEAGVSSESTSEDKPSSTTSCHF